MDITALIVSILSLTLSLYAVSRDRGRLKTESGAYKSEQTGEFSTVYVKAVNVGRRPVILKYLQGIYGDKKHIKANIKLADKGILLDEGQFFDYRFTKFDGIVVFEDEESGQLLKLRDLFFIDSAGKKYKIKHVKHNIKLADGSKHPFGADP